MKEIKEYIQFAIDNGYREGFSIKLWSGIDGISIQFISKSGSISFGLINEITSKEFIESISRGAGEIYLEKGEIKIGKMIYRDFEQYLDFEELIDEITKEQSIAIRDNKLLEFITNLGIGQDQ